MHLTSRLARAYGRIAQAQLLAQCDNHAQVLQKQHMAATK